jgi:outer membrane protein TolC
MFTHVHAARRHRCRLFLGRPLGRFICRPLRLAAAFLLTALALPTAVADPALDLATAMALADTLSQAVPAQQAAALAARERAVAAGQRPDPVLRIGLDNVPIEGSTTHLLTREPTTARSIGINQALPDAAKRAARSDRFEQVARLADAQVQARRSELQRETALAWWAVHAETRRLALLAAQRTEAELTVQAAEAAYRAGRGAQAEVFMARAAPARLDDTRLQAEARLANARSALRRWVGAPADGPLADPPALTALAVPPPERLADLDATLQAAVAAEAAARAATRVADEERRADWSVDLRFAQRGPRYDNMVTVGLSLPLRWDPANRQDRELAARQAEALQAEAEAEELRRSRRALIERWHQGWQSGLARLAGIDGELLPLAAARTHAALAAYRAGSGALQPVLDARQAELALQLERLQVELETASNAMRLTTLNPEAAR